MFDPFGLKEGIPEEHDLIETVDAGGGNRQKRLWAVLLILDTIFLLIFGGALSSMIYIRWSRPAVVSIRQLPRKAEPKRPTPAVPAAPAALTPAITAAAPAPAPAPAKPAAPVARTPAPKEPKTPVAAKNTSKGPLGSPSVLAPDLPSREATLNGSPVSAPAKHTAETPRPKPAGKARAVEFTCDAPNARDVKLKGPFLVRSGGIKKMVRGGDGVWRTTISLVPGISYHYSFVIDGVKSKPQSVDVE